MSGEKERVDDYLATINRLEPDIAFIDASAFYASAAISLKRIADNLDRYETRVTASLAEYKEYLDSAKEEKRKRDAQPFWRFILGFKP